MVNSQEVINNAISDDLIIKADEYEENQQNSKVIGLITTAFEQVCSAKDHLCLGAVYEAAKLLDAIEVQLIKIRRECEKG